MHYLQAEQYTYLAGEINALYHEAAVKMAEERIKETDLTYTIIE